MNRATFFDAIRPAFGGKLDAGQVTRVRGSIVSLGL